MIVKTDCLHFRGDIPCIPHKLEGVHCEGCPYFTKISKKILIIKLGAIGDVIRTTPLLRKIKEIHPHAQIFWLTYTPEILSKNYVDRILSVNPESIELLKNIEFDWLINLDKDSIAIALANSVSSKKKSGFNIDEFGHAKPFGSNSENHKWLTGLFDDVNKTNTKHYIQEMFEICDFTFTNQEYIIEKPESSKEFNIDHSKKVVGLNTGCGGRWISRLWPEEHWVKLATMLLKNNFEVVLLGGQQEHERNEKIQKLSGAKYFGYFSLKEFILLMDGCDLIVSAVTMAMHLAIALKKKLILYNNIFNKHEFYLYSRGVILEPDFVCNCYYKPVCENNCMQYLKPETVFNNIVKL